MENQQQHTTQNITVPNNDLEILKQHFPQCFDKDGNFQLEKFRKNLESSEINFSTESYGMDWLGKAYARLLASDPATTLLKADEAHNAKSENKDSENLLIKGDNLEVLKHLSNAYHEKIKMIYIDPPYNTGSDGFVYQDDRKFTVPQLRELAGVSEEQAQRILAFTQSKSNSHSAWLTFMYPRLYIAKQLLKDDGVIFISIDDNEVAQLRLLMDEVFGEENFVGEFIWRKKEGGGQTKDFFVIEHEYILVFRKDSSFVWSDKIIKRDIVEYNKLDEKGNFKITKLAKWGNTARKEDRPSMYFPLISPDNIEVFPIAPDGNDGRWRVGKERMDKIINDKLLHWEKKDENWIAYEKEYFNNQNKIIKQRSILYNIANTGDGANELTNLFGVKDVFVNPKPFELLTVFISQSTNSNDLILDFFAGSGTTGDAVMQLNAEDNGNRKYILVQLPETIDPKKSTVAYNFVKDQLHVAEPTIFDITKERLIRAAAKIKTEKPDADIYFGFKVFETTPVWEDYDFEANEFDAQQELFDADTLTPDEIKSLLVTWKTADGIPLTEDLREITLNGNYTAYYGNGKLYLMNAGFTTEHLKALLEKTDADKTFNPAAIIAFGYHFDTKNLREIAENVKSYANKKKIDIDFITRY